MEEGVLRSPIDNRKISLNGMSKRELRDLHYKEEIKMAKLLLAFPPFSKERKQLLNCGYEFVEGLKLRYENNENKSFGASPASVNLVKSIVENRQKGGQNTQVVYEAGVGMGYAIKELAAIPGVKFYGCDVMLLPTVKKLIQENYSLFIREGTLFDALKKLDDSFIDVFYADNVLEHLFPDEIFPTLKRLNRKMKKGGQLIWIIPNRNMGPNDVSKYYLPKGSRATGFHFMEMSYWESIRLALRCGFKPNWIIKRSGGGFCLEEDFLWMKNVKRIIREQIIVHIDNMAVREELLSADVYNIYVLEK